MASKKDVLNYSTIYKTSNFIWQIREDGQVLRTCQKTMKEKKLKPWLHNGRAVVNICGREYAVKSLVAQHFMPGWIKGMMVENIDGKPMHCAIWNLRAADKTEHMRKLGENCKKAKKVTINDIQYSSMRKAAKAMYVSSTTFWHYVQGTWRPENTILAGINVGMDFNDR